MAHSKNQNVLEIRKCVMFLNWHPFTWFGFWNWNWKLDSMSRAQPSNLPKLVKLWMVLIACKYIYSDPVSPKPRLAILCLLRCRIGDFAAHFAIKCSSLCQMNAGTSKRGACCSIGYTEYLSVQISNILVERTLCVMEMSGLPLGLLYHIQWWRSPPSNVLC